MSELKHSFVIPNATIEEHKSNDVYRPVSEFLDKTFVELSKDFEPYANAEESGEQSGAFFVDDIYVSMPTDVEIGIEVKNKKVVSVFENKSGQAEREKYSTFDDSFNRAINDTTGQVLIFKPYWKDGKVDRFRNLSAIDVICANRYCVVLGAPGSGKSTLLKYLTRSLIKQLNDKTKYALEYDTKSTLFRDETYLPIFVRLRNISPVNTVDEFLSLIFKGIEIDDMVGLKKYLSEQKLIFLFDGVDEIFASNNQGIGKLIENLIGIARNINENARVVLSSRKERVDWIPPYFYGFELEPMTDECKMQLAQKRLCDDNLLTAFWEQLNQSRRDGRMDESILGNPLLFTLILGIFRSEKILPDNIGYIMQQSVKELIRRWKRKTSDSQLELSNLMNILQKVAYGTMLEGSTPKLTFDSSAIFAVMSKEVNKWKIPNTNIDAVYSCLINQVGIIIEKNVDSNATSTQCEFAHRYFHEYLAATKVIAEGDRLFEKIIEKLEQSHEKYGEFILMITEIWHDTRLPRMHMIWQLLWCLAKYAEGASREKRVWLAWLCGKILSCRDYKIVRNLNDKWYFHEDTTLELCNRLLLEAIESKELELAKKIECGRFVWEIKEKIRSDVAGSLKVGDMRDGVGTIKTEKEALPDIKWCKVIGGRFALGLNEKEVAEIGDRFVNSGFSRETPCVDTTVDSFYIAKYPITIDQYRAFVDAGAYREESFWQWSKISSKWYKDRSYMLTEEYVDALFDNTGNAPMTNISWIEAKTFCEWLSIKTGEKIRLPYEAEWEYVARLLFGGNYAVSKGFDKDLYIGAQLKLDKAAPVGLVLPSTDALTGLSGIDEYPCDLNGNVWEWTQTFMREETLKNYSRAKSDLEYSCGNLRTDLPMVVRGGSFLNSEFQLRNTYRGRDYIEDHITSRQGFRIVKEMNNG